MDLSKIRMVVTDMDGTLLNSKHEVSDYFFELFSALKSKGILFVAASGRQYNSIIDKLDSIKNDIIVIAENGGFAKQNENEILSTPLNNNYIKDVLKTLKEVPNTHPVLCGKHMAYISGESNAFVEKLKEYYTQFEIMEELKPLDTEILKIAIYHFESSEKYIYPHVKHFEENLQVKVSGENWVDISSPNAHKGYALEKVMQIYGIKSHEIMVFGDYNNDLEMLELSDYSFAMENAHPNIKEAAKYSTLSNDEMGVELQLKKLVLR
ncbi:HAD family hydrolase [Maribacter sp. PR1]|uniref:HAD family hydrolase n=1 Tax=Maribacter cobaltidurans TaxID=1178778 RepID=A0ABU7IZX3_9FLAO|nr:MULTISPECIES: HAD family hydrolase [Maribacter]MDC6391058.1 HAD family hydrolase [Maribacter sp. PR1]MEE1978450.1 HAD family hydrolase [Maribacter cobaltidurans]